MTVGLYSAILAVQILPAPSRLFDPMIEGRYREPVQIELAIVFEKDGSTGAEKRREHANGYT